MAYLVLENGKSFEGDFFVNSGNTVGEVVFVDNMVSYEEILTDEKYADKIVVFSYIMIGNYGFNKADMVNKKVYPSGIIAKEFCMAPSNFRCDQSIEEFCRVNELTAFCNCDTREIVRYIVKNPKIRGAIVESADQKIKF